MPKKKLPITESPEQISVKLSERTRAQLHYLLVERHLTTDENVTISGIIAAAVGAFARARGWSAEGRPKSDKPSGKRPARSAK